VHRGQVLVEIRKGLYGLPQAGIIANVRLKKHLAQHGYLLADHTPGLYHHETRPISFALVADDFAIKYVGKEHAEHLFETLREIYTITIDWTGTKFCGLTLKWDYDNGTVDISMPGYIAKCLARFQHKPTKRPQHAPHAWIPPSYGVKTQVATPQDASPLLDPAGITRIQQIVGVLLHWRRCHMGHFSGQDDSFPTENSSLSEGVLICPLGRAYLSFSQTTSPGALPMSERQPRYNARQAK
jgi:hypothetical protein